MPQVGINNRGGQRRYGYLLRPIGAYLDALDARYVTLAEIEEGFIWHCFSRGDPTTILTGTIALDDIAALIETTKRSKEIRGRTQEELLRMRRAGRGLFRKGQAEGPGPEFPPHPVFPEGYEEMFRSLGVKIEDQRGYMVLLVERAASLVVSFSLPLPTYIRVDISRMETFTGFHEVEYSAGELMAIIDTVRGHRGIPYYQ
jgi:hypothetical protein